MCLQHKNGVKVVPRYWSYWTETKLEILSKYLPAFNVASKRAGPTLYLDLMSGEPENVSRRTGLPLDGSPRIAMAVKPPFNRLMLFEKSKRRTSEWRREIGALAPDIRERVTLYEGDCNERLADALGVATREGYRRRPVFALIDQQVAEIRWSSLASLAQFRTGRYKTELWMLLSPTWMWRSLSSGQVRPNARTVERISDMYGSDEWLRILQARELAILNPEGFGDEMINLMRWHLQERLGYTHTVRIPLTLLGTRQRAYEMIFATDNAAGLKIMSDIYRGAAERHREMAQEARAATWDKADANKPQGVLFENSPNAVNADFIPEWKPDVPWHPASRPWWNA